jgi:hypothetical protein
MLLENFVEQIFAGTIGKFFEILIEIVILPVTTVIAFTSILMSIISILILCIVLIVLFVALIRWTKPTLKEALIMAGMSLLQTLIFAIFFLTIKIIFGVWISAYCNGSFYGDLEIIMVFLILIFIADIFGELVRNLALKHNFKAKWIALFVSIIQTTFLMILIYSMAMANIIDLQVVLANGDYIGFIFEILYFFVPILVAELLIETLRTYIF